jgi:excisionase family DNA binding protein
MTTTHPPKKPESGSTHAAECPVPREETSPEPGPSAERLAYSVDEAAHLTGLSRDLLYDEMRRGHLSYIKVGRRRLITRQHLEQFLNITPRMRTAAAADTASNLKAASNAP